MSAKGKIIVILAPSGTGKSTLIKRLKEEFRELHWSVSFTTRDIRAGETDGKHYFFISKEEFLKKKEQGDFVEWAEVHGNYYGTSKGFVASKVDHGFSILFELDVQGADSMKEHFGDLAQAVFICPPSMEILEERLRNRKTDSNEVIEVRLQNAQREMKRKNDYDFCIVNDDLDTSYIELREIVTKIMRA